jgi:gas vesicle protein
MYRLLVGAAAGAACAYLFDPRLGRHRRDMLWHKLVHAVKAGRQFARIAARDLRNRTQGGRTRLLQIAHKGAEVSDQILVQRVRAKLGRYVSHPKAIAVNSIRGSVDLSGDVLASEYDMLMKAVGAVRGVKTVEDRLAVHRSAEGVPALQGGSSPPGEPGELAQRIWPPAVRLASGIAGAMLIAYAAARRGPLRPAAALAGAAILARVISNRPLAEVADRPVEAREVPLAPAPEPGAWSVEGT